MRMPMPSAALPSTFQSAPAIAGGRCVPANPRHALQFSFQSAPAIAGGRCGAQAVQVVEGLPVSIRARHCWRAMRSARPGCIRPAASFNPRPPLLAGDAGHLAHVVLAVDVSIRARHCWRAMLSCRCPARPRSPVSIRARHCWRAMLGVAAFVADEPLVSIRARHCWRAMLFTAKALPALHFFLFARELSFDHSTGQTDLRKPERKACSNNDL